MESIKEEIAKNIRFQRKRKGLTQKDLADALNLRASAVSNWESCQNSIDIDTLFKVCEVLKCTVSDLYGIYALQKNTYSEKEKNVIQSYRLHPEFQPAVDKLLDLTDDTVPEQS